MTTNRKKLRRQKKCGTISRAMQVLALAGLLWGGAAGAALAASPVTITDNHQVSDGATEEFTTIDVNSGGTLGIARNGKVIGTDVTVNVGGILTSVKNLHFGTFNPAPNTGLLGDTLTLDGGTVTAQHMGLAPGGTVTLKKGLLTLNSLDMGGGTFAFTVAGGDSATFTLLGTTDGTAFLQGTSLGITAGSNVFLGSDAGPGGNQTSTTALAVSGGTLQVGHGNWKTGALSQSAGNVKVSGNSVLTVDSLNQTGGLITIGGTSNTGTLVVNGAVGNVAHSANTSGIAVTGTGVLDVQYSQLVNSAGNDFLNTSTQKAINVDKGGMLSLSGYGGSGMTLADFGTLTGKLLASGSTGTVSGVTITDVTDTTALQDVADARAALSSAVVDGSGGISSGAAAVGGVKGATTISGNASLTLTGQNAGNVMADSGVTLNSGILTLGNTAGGSTGGTLNGGINASTGTNTINVVNGAHTVNGGITGGANTTVVVGGTTSAGTLIATDIAMNGGQINFDPPFVATGDTSNASLGGLTFASNAVDALMNVGQNSMVSLGSTNAEWLRTEVTRYQQDGKGLWGQDITAALALRAPQTLDATGGINVNGTWVHGGAAATANTATFADKSLLVVDAAGIGTGVALSGESGGTSTLTVDSGAKLHIVGGQGGDTVNITGGFGASTKDAASWMGDNLTTSTGLLSATGGTFDATTGSYNVSLSANSAKLVFPLLSDSMAGLVDSVFAQTRLDVNADNAGVRFLSRATSDNYIGRSDTKHAAATIEGAAQMAVVGAVPGVTLSALNAATNAVTTRTSFASPLLDKTKAVAMNLDTDGNVSLDSGLSAGNGPNEGMKNGLGVWIMPLYQSENVWGMKSENFKTGYNSDLGGVALGADYTFADAFRVGVALNLGGGYAQSSGDFNKTDNSFNFWGVGLYGGWTQNNFGLTADAGYTSNYSKVKQELPQSMQMGELKADVTSYAITAGLRGEYKVETSIMDIIPHISARYTSLNVDSYDVKNNGTVFGVEQSQQNIWTFPIGVTFSKDIETSKGWIFKPQVDLAIIPAAGDVKTKSKSRIPGVGSTAELETQVVDYMTYQGGIGFDVQNDNLSFGINYNIQASEHRTGHGVFGTVRYEF